MLVYMKILNRILFTVILVAGFECTLFAEEKKIQLKNDELNFFSGMFDFSDEKQRAVLLGFQHQNEELYRDTFLGNLLDPNLA